LSPGATKVIFCQTKHSDPRFNSLSGAYNPSKFEQSYSFLKQKRKEEIEQLRSAVKKASGKRKSSAKEDTEVLTRTLTRMESQHAAAEEKERQQTVLRNWKKEEREKRKLGKRAFHLKQSQSISSVYVLSAYHVM
jgi:ribosomal RNA-processing protein 36